MRVIPAYISVGVNRSSSCATRDSSGVVAFGAGRYVSLWETRGESSRGVSSTLPGHLGQVTTVRILREDNGRGVFVSGDSLGEVRLWAPTGDRTRYTSTPISAHSPGAISAIAVPPATGPLAGHLVTAGSDSKIKLWNISSGSAELGQTIDLGGKIALDLVLASLPGSDAPILVAALTDRRIRIYTFSLQGRFTHSISLEGHEDWVRCLAITSYPSSTSIPDLLLASGSKDNYIRLWRISPVAITEDSAGDGLDMLDEFERKLAGEVSGSVQISTRAHVLSVEDRTGPRKYDITLEALLIGHESGITNLAWSSQSSPRLLSSASDNSLILWEPSEASTSADGIWVPEHRFGALGGRGLGFYGALWSGEEGDQVMAGGWNGGCETWKKSEGEGESGWETARGTTGHFGEVKGLVWDPTGDYLLSVSSDQTSRIHAKSQVAGSSSWAEIARPQIHGYDMTDAVFLSPYRFASTSDEKVTRVFDAPAGFVESLSSLGVSKDEQDLSARPMGATVPPLGLSNRAIGKAFTQPEIPTSQNQATDSISQTFTSLPTEEELASTTLWPEIEKIYGHGYELVTLAASHDGSLIATACRASNAEHAIVRITSTTTWEEVGEPLTGHSLTITRIVFSPDDSRILTCSRDRSWRLYAKGDKGYVPLAQEERSHSRMVLDCCWAPDGETFVTASRDKTVKIWREGGTGENKLADTIKLTESATAVDMIDFGGRSLLAVGGESGSLEIFEVGTTASSLVKLDECDSHIATVNRVAWSVKDGKVRLASCSDDRSVRVFEVEPQ